MSKSDSQEPTPEKASRGAITFVLTTLAINAMGFGIIVPVLPDLIAEVSSTSISGAALWGGYLSFSFAAMQFLVGPTVGNLSDRFGRRPVLLVSLGGLAIDFLIMAMASSLLMLFIGRILSGIASATNSTANAFIADISSKENRAKNFGLIGAAFGFGFIIGPVIGGIAGEYGTRAPFYVAAALAFANLCFGAIVLPETLTEEKRRPFEWLRANPAGGLKQVSKIPMVAWFMAAVFLFEIANFVYPSVWAYYTKEAIQMVKLRSRTITGRRWRWYCCCSRLADRPCFKMAGRKTHIHRRRSCWRQRNDWTDLRHRRLDVLFMAASSRAGGNSQPRHHRPDVQCDAR